MSLVELLDQVFVQDVPRWHPRSLLRTITLPVDEVLQAPSLPTGMDQAADSEGRTTIDQARRRRRRSNIWRQAAFMYGLDSEHVECGMDSHATRKRQPHGRRVDDFLNGERTHKLRGEFSVLKAKREIFRRQPNSLTHLVCRSWGATTVGRGGVMLHRPLEGGSSSGPGSAATAGEGEGRGTGDIFVQGERRLVPIDTLEGGQTSGRTGEGVMGILHP